MIVMKMSGLRPSPLFIGMTRRVDDNLGTNPEAYAEYLLLDCCLKTIGHPDNF